MGAWYDFISQYGYIAIFCLLTLGIVGLPIPDEILLTYLGYVTSIGQMVYVYTFLAAFLGSALGITINYYLGVKLGEPFLRKFGPKVFISERTIERTNRLFHKYGAFVLFVCYFIPGIRHVAAYFAGVTHFKYRRFAFYTYTGAMVWVLIFLTLGNRLGTNWEIISTYLSKYIVVVIFGIVIFGICAYVIARRRRRSDSLF